MSEPRWLSADEQRTWRAFLEASRMFWDVVDGQLLDEAGIPHAYYEILVRLSESPRRELRMSELAASLRASRSRLSHSVARLEERGWVERRTCPSDRRGQLAVLTDEGFAALAAAAPGHVETVRRALFDPLTEDQLATLRTVSEEVRAGLCPSGGPAVSGREPLGHPCEDDHERESRQLGGPVGEQAQCEQ